MPFGIGFGELLLIIVVVVLTAVLVGNAVMATAPRR